MQIGGYIDSVDEDSTFTFGGSCQKMFRVMRHESAEVPLKTPYQNQQKGVLEMKQRKHVFTLIELLIVLCTIAILATILLPALQDANRNASDAACVSNLGQLSKAFQIYATEFDDYMPALTPTQQGSGKTGWEYALIDAVGQDRNNSSLRKSFFCSADAAGNSQDGNRKSYSLNNLQQVIHPLIDNTINGDGKVVKNTGSDKGYISGNKTSAVLVASDLIVIGENVSPNNTFGNATFSSTDIRSPGSASAVHQQVAIYKQLTSHKTAGNLFLDGHAVHRPPQQTMPTNKGLFNISNKTFYCDSNPSGGATEGFGSWTDCPKRKRGDSSCPGDFSCHSK